MIEQIRTSGEETVHTPPNFDFLVVNPEPQTSDEHFL